MTSSCPSLPSMFGPLSLFLSRVVGVLLGEALSPSFNYPTPIPYPFTCKLLLYSLFHQFHYSHGFSYFPHKTSTFPFETQMFLFNWEMRTYLLGWLFSFPFSSPSLALPPPLSLSLIFFLFFFFWNGLVRRLMGKQG